MDQVEEKSFVRIPPDDDSLNHHLKRANYLTFCQSHFWLLEHPSPIGNGWQFINGKCRPVRHVNMALPLHLPSQDADDTDESDDERSEIGDSTDDEENL